MSDVWNGCGSEKDDENLINSGSWIPYLLGAVLIEFSRASFSQKLCEDVSNWSCIEPARLIFGGASPIWSGDEASFLAWVIPNKPSKILPEMGSGIGFTNINHFPSGVLIFWGGVHFEGFIDQIWDPKEKRSILGLGLDING